MIQRLCLPALAAFLTATAPPPSPAPLTEAEAAAVTRLGEELAGLLLAKSKEDVAKLVVPKDVLARVLAPALAKELDKVFPALVEGNLAVFGRRTALLGDAASLTFQRVDPGTLTSSTHYVPGTHVRKNTRITVGDAHRVTLTLNVEEILLVDGRAWLLKLD